jgi:glycosyltransferase involved in cell wall biosynthesis
MNRQPGLVSVVIPFYNHGRFLMEAIDSILAQTYRDFEIIVVDDGSDDPQSLAVLDAIRIPQVTIHHKHNGHLASARNFGIQRSRGELILTLDADDRFHPTFLEKAVPILEKRADIGVVTCHVIRFGSRTGLDGHIWRPKGGTVIDFLIENNCCGNALFRYRCWEDAGGYDENLRGFEDWDFWIGVTEHGWRIHTIPEVLFDYRDTPGSLLKTAKRNRPELMKRIVANHLETFRSQVADVIYRMELERDAVITEQARRFAMRALPCRIGNALLAPINWARRRPWA